MSVSGGLVNVTIAEVLGSTTLTMQNITDRDSSIRSSSGVMRKGSSFKQQRTNIDQTPYS